jgi:1,4-dihydroxy-2-naphthoate octaprenyltransferase
LLKKAAYLFLGSRPQFLIAGLALFGFGAAWANLSGATFSLARLALGYLIILSAQLSISYSNDYFDAEADRFSEPTLFSGGSGVLLRHPELRRAAWWMAVGLILCSLGLGIAFHAIYAPSPWLLVFVLAGNLIGWFYSAPPARLAYRSLGELSHLISAGLLIPGTGYLVGRGFLDGAGLLFTVPLTLYGLVLIVAVEIPDEEADRLGGKRTLVARQGKDFGFRVIGLALLLATVFFFGFPFLTSTVYPFDFRVLGTLSCLPLAAGGIAVLIHPSGRQAVTRTVYVILVTTVAFLILADGYFLLR